MHMQKRALLLLIFVFIYFLSPSLKADDLQKVNSKIITNYKQDHGFHLNKLFKQVDPLLEDVFKLGNVWRKDGMFLKLLSPYIGSLDNEPVSNPYWGYAVMKYLQSDNYTKGGNKAKNEVCFQLLKLLADEKYEHQHGSIFGILFSHFGDVESYTQESVALIEQMICQEKPFYYRLLLLPPISQKELTDSVREKLITLAKPYKVFDTGNVSGWLSVVLLAKEGRRLYLGRIVDIVQQLDSSSESIYLTKEMLPFLSLVKDPMIIDLLKWLLQDDTIIDQGADVMMRYTGRSRIAAEVLANMLEDYTTFSKFSYNQAERKKCLDWFNQNKTYKFKVEIDYSEIPAY